MGDSLLALAKSIYYEHVLLDSLIKVKKQNGNNSLSHLFAIDFRIKHYILHFV